MGGCTATRYCDASFKTRVATFCKGRGRGADYYDRTSSEVVGEIYCHRTVQNVARRNGAPVVQNRFWLSASGSRRIILVLATNALSGPVRTSRSERTIPSRDEPEEGGHLYGGLFDAGRLLLGHQLRGDEIRCRVHSSSTHRGFALRCRRRPDVLPPPPPGAGRQAQTEGPSPRSWFGVPGSGDRPDGLYIWREHDQCCQHRSHLRHSPHLGAAPWPDARAGEARVEGRRGRGTLDPGCRHCLLRGPRDRGNEPGRGSFRARGGDGIRELHCTIDARAGASLAADGGDLLLALRGDGPPAALFSVSHRTRVGERWGRSMGGRGLLGGLGHRLL